MRVCHAKRRAAAPITELRAIGVAGVHACDDGTKHPRSALRALPPGGLERVVTVCMKPFNEAAPTLHAIFYEGRASDLLQVKLTPPNLKSWG